MSGGNLQLISQTVGVIYKEYLQISMKKTKRVMDKDINSSQ